jgi:DNA-binding NtrC family response regulator/Tfp pilus assembly protein PilF
MFEIPEIQRIEKRLETLRSVSGSPEYLERLNLLADIYLKEDGYEPALEYLEEILSETHRLQISDKKRIRLHMRVIDCLLKRSRCTEALEKCKAVADDLETQHDEELRAQLNLLLSEANWKMGDYPNALIACQDAVQLFVNLGDERGVAQCQSCFGKSYLRLGRFEAAREHFEEGLAIYRRLRDKGGIAVCHNNLGLMHKNRGEWQLASDHLTKALELDRESGNYGKIALRLLNLGLVYYKTCQWGRAKEAMEEALGIATRIGDQHTRAAASIGVGNCLRLLGDPNGADRLYKQASSIAEKERLLRELALAHEFAGESELSRGNLRRALRKLDRALAIAEGIAPDGDIVAEVQRGRAEVLLELAEAKKASKALRRSLRLCRLLGDKYEEGAVLSVIARVKAKAGCRRSAMVAFNGSVKCRESVGDKYGLACTLLHFGRFVRSAPCSQDESRQARLALARAAGLFAELGAESLLGETVKELASAWGERAGASSTADTAHTRSQKPCSTHGFVTYDASLMGVIRSAEQSCRSDTRVLIQGETGVGKNLLAYIFKAYEESRGRVFVELNCATIPAELLESELFGYAKGAFSGANSDKKGILEEANGGTLFLNEIAEMDSKMQAKLLQFLDDGSYRRVGDTRLRKLHTRVVCATNKDLWQQVERGTFRRDLYFRLSQSVLNIKPLRERSEDVVVLVRHFVEMYCELYSKQLSLDPRAIELMQRHSWPGNVRELKSKVQLLVLESPAGAIITASDVARMLSTPEGEVEPRTLADKIELLKRAEIARALARFGGNKTKAAQALGISRRGLVKVAERMDTPSRGPRRDRAG